MHKPNIRIFLSLARRLERLHHERRLAAALGLTAAEMKLARRRETLVAALLELEVAA